MAMSEVCEKLCNIANHGFLFKWIKKKEAPRFVEVFHLELASK